MENGNNVRAIIFEDRRTIKRRGAVGKCNLENQFISGRNELVFWDKSTEVLTLLEINLLEPEFYI